MKIEQSDFDELTKGIDPDGGRRIKPALQQDKYWENRARRGDEAGFGIWPSDDEKVWNFERY